MTEEALIPDLDRKVFKTIQKVEETKPKSEGEKRSEAIASLKGYVGWEKGIKPYIEARISSLKTLMEVDFDGKETVNDVGLRFLLCSQVAKELQDILNWVEVTAESVEAREKKEKKKRKK
jgi:hypothetical protein